MAVILNFHGHHARASAGSRAAKVVNTSAVTPALTARSVPITADHHSAGMLSRWDHFKTAEVGAPTSAPIARHEGHRSIMDWKDGNWVMPNSIGQTVLICKDHVSLDCELPLGHNVPMTKKVLTDFECRFLARTYAARKIKFEAGDDIAPKLKRGMKQDIYKQYETRSALPYELVDQFLSLTGVSYEWLFTGRGDGPEWHDRYEKLRARQPAPKKARKAA